MFHGDANNTHHNRVKIIDTRQLKYLVLKTLENPLDLGSPLTRRSNQSILKEINVGYSLAGLMLKLQYFGHLMGRESSLERR